MADNLIISNSTSFLILFLYLLSLVFIMSTLSSTRNDIKKLKFSKNEVSSSNLNYLSLNKSTPKAVDTPSIHIKRDTKQHDPERAIVNSFWIY